MASISRLALAQLAAIARIRWQMSLSRLRTGRAKFEVFSKVVTMAALVVTGFGPAVGIGFAAYHSTVTPNVRLLAGILWLVFFAWQFLPTLVVAFTEAWDTTVLRRYPLSPVTYLTVWLLSGAVDPGSLVAGLWLFAIFIGLSLASPILAPWTFVVLLTFASFNLLLSRLVLAWLSHWLEKRRTREIIGVLFIFLAIGNQFIAQMAERHLPRHLHSNVAGRFTDLLSLLPPGLAAKSLVPTPSRFFAATTAFTLLLLYLVVLASLVAIRVRAEYLGESRGESGARATINAPTRRRQAAIELLGVPHAISAVFVKELRTLLRSPQIIASMLFVPPLVVIVFGRFGASTTLAKSADLGFAFGLANAVLALTRLIYNSFGTERTGVQFYYLAPVRFRQFVLGKNLAYAAILLLQTVLVFIAVALLFGFPSVAGSTLAIVALLFAAIVNISAGNLLSLIIPKREDFSLRQRGSTASGLAALGVQFTVLGIAVPLFLFVRRSQLAWVGVLGFLLLAVLASAIYLVVLSQVDKVADKRREIIIAELCRSN